MRYAVRRSLVGLFRLRFRLRHYLRVIFVCSICIFLLADLKLTQKERKLKEAIQSCIVQLTGAENLQNGSRISSVGARLSTALAHRYAIRYGYNYHLYNCNEHCSKPPSLWNACFEQKCSHVYYMDVDAFILDSRVDVIQYILSSYPDAVMVTGPDEYTTLAQPKQHNGQWRLWLTSANTGMIVFNCNKPESARILAEWERLCRRYSPYTSDQEALTLMETFPQHVSAKTFARDTLVLGQYSTVARHFAGDRAKAYRFPLSVQETKKRVRRSSVLRNSKYFKWLRTYAINERIPGRIPPEKWVLPRKITNSSWSLPKLKACPLKASLYRNDLLERLKIRRHNKLESRIHE